MAEAAGKESLLCCRDTRQEITHTNHAEDTGEEMKVYHVDVDQGWSGYNVIVSAPNPKKATEYALVEHPSEDTRLEHVTCELIRALDAKKEGVIASYYYGD